MGLGRRPAERQTEFWIPVDRLARTPHHIFYARLNELLAEARFDAFVEKQCLPFYKELGRLSIPPGRYFRMLFVGYFEGLDSQRGIAWRCADSLSLRKFLFLTLDENVPDHSSLTRIRDRLDAVLHEKVFAFMLQLAEERKLLSGTTVGTDSTTIEANAAMKSIVRRDTGESYKAFIKRLMIESGATTAENPPSDEDIRRFDRKRPDKKVSNEDFVSKTDPDARITKMKDGTTHLAYKAEHTVDLESELILGVTIHPGTEADTGTVTESLLDAQINLVRAGSAAEIEAAGLDKGYSSEAVTENCAALGITSYIPVKKAVTKPELPPAKPVESGVKLVESGEQHGDSQATAPGIGEELSAPTNGAAGDELSAFETCRERAKTPEAKRIQRRRSEVVERTFAHVCETGGARRTHLRGLEKVKKRYMTVVAARNLSVILRKVWGFGKPRTLQGRKGFGRGLSAAFGAFFAVLTSLLRHLFTRFRPQPA